MRFAVIAVVLGACVAEDDATTITVPEHELVPDDGATEDEICAAASALPASDVCSLVCDPDAFRSRLVDDGMRGGACYQFRCNLAPDMSVTVGVCLP